MVSAATSGASSAQPRDIVILGGSFAGQSAAHWFFKHVAPTLESHASGATFRVKIVDVSTHFWWRVSAPRAMVTTDTVPHDKAFLPITKGFSQYSNLKRASFDFVHAEIESVDFEARTVSVKHLSADKAGHSEALPYYALVIATGTHTPTALTSLQGDHSKSVDALNAMQKRLASGQVKDIVIAGGGPTGVESAGEIGEALNGTAGFFSSSPSNPKAKITLVTSSNKLLPVLNKAQSDKAEKFLKRVGVDVIYGTRVASVDNESAAIDTQRTVHLDNGKSLAADVYLPAAGTFPNSGYLPASLLDARGYVETAKTLRVANVGARVYAVGDVANYSPTGGVMSLYAAVPIWGANFAADLWAELDPAQKPAAAAADKEFVDKTAGTQLVPVGRTKGVAAFGGWSLPSFIVGMTKGKDYMLSMTDDIVQGKKYA